MSLLLATTPLVVAGSLTDATAKEVLGTSYADLGGKLNVNGLQGIQLHTKELDNSEAGTVKFLVSPEHVQPTSNSAMFTLADADGSAKEITVVQNSERAVELPVSAKWLQAQGKSTGGAAAASVFLASNVVNAMGSPIAGAKAVISATAVALGASAAEVGEIVDITGLGGLTLYVDNSTGSGNATVTVYTDIESLAAPADTSEMKVLAADGGTAKTFVTLSGEKAAHFIGNLSGKFLGIKGVGANAAIAVSLLGMPNGVNVE